jgi:hypothetical protein
MMNVELDSRYKTNINKIVSYNKAKLKLKRTELLCRLFNLL